MDEDIVSIYPRSNGKYLPKVTMNGGVGDVVVPSVINECSVVRDVACETHLLRAQDEIGDVREGGGRVRHERLQRGVPYTKLLHPQKRGVGERVSVGVRLH